MAAEARRFEPVEIPEPPEQSATERAAASFAANAITLGLKVLSQRAIAAVKDVFTLLSVASCFWLWHSTPNPEINQIVSLTLYAVFILSANVIVRKV